MSKVGNGLCLQKPVGALVTWNWNSWVHEHELLENRIAPLYSMHVSVRLA